MNKIAEITALFWIAKIIATTLGETAGDFLAQTLDLGDVVGFAITAALLVAVLFAQVRGDRYHPSLFWAGVVATTAAGTEISDMMDRTFSAGYVLGSTILFAGLLATPSSEKRPPGTREPAKGMMISEGSGMHAESIAMSTATPTSPASEMMRVTTATTAVMADSIKAPPDRHAARSTAGE